MDSGDRKKYHREIDIYRGRQRTSRRRKRVVSLLRAVSYKLKPKQAVRINVSTSLTLEEENIDRYGERIKLMTFSDLLTGCEPVAHLIREMLCAAER